MLELVHDIRAKPKWIHNHLVSQKLNEIAATETGGVLVLHSSFNANVVSFDHIGQLCNLVIGHWDALKFLQKSNQGHHQTGGRTQTRAGRSITTQEKVKAVHL